MKKTGGMKPLFLVLVAVIAVAAGVGYFKQSSVMRTADDANATTSANTAADTAARPAPDVSKPAPQPQLKLPPASDAIFHARPGDIVMGKDAAPVTIVEYASLSCPHCAHFFKESLPDVKKDLLDTGKAKLVFRHFPLNLQALRAAQLVQCADANQRENFVKVLFEMQDQWAYTPQFLDQLKQIASVGGVDAAKFKSCMDDKKLEDTVLNSRQEAVTKLGVNSTPTFFINGVEFKGDNSPQAIEDAVSKAH